MVKAWDCLQCDVRLHPPVRFFLYLMMFITFTPLSFQGTFLKLPHTWSPKPKWTKSKYSTSRTTILILQTSTLASSTNIFSPRYLFEGNLRRSKAEWHQTQLKGPKGYLIPSRPRNSGDFRKSSTSTNWSDLGALQLWRWEQERRWCTLTIADSHEVHDPQSFLLPNFKSTMEVQGTSFTWLYKPTLGTEIGGMTWTLMAPK